MDPLSTVVAFVGLSASMITISDTVVKVSKKVLELQKKFKDAPKKLLRLYHDLQRLDDLLRAIHARICSDEAVNYPPELRALCQNFTTQLEQDLDELHEHVSEAISKWSIAFGKGLRARAQYVSTENAIPGFHREISAHVAQLTLIQTMMNKYVSTQTM